MSDVNTRHGIDSGESSSSREIMQVGKARSGSAQGRLGRGAIAMMLALVGVLSLAEGSALASQSFIFQTSFGTSSAPSGIATDNAGDVYIYDPSAGTVSKRSPTGESLEFSSGISEIENVSGGNPEEVEIAVDNSTTGHAAGDIYVATASSVHIYDSEGKPLGELTAVSGGGQTCGVAVDSSGDVFIGEYPSTVNEYVPAANPVTSADLTTSLKGGSLDEICNVAVDPAGNVYAANYAGSGVTKFSASEFGGSPPTGTLISSSGATLATDASGNVYIDEVNQVVVYDTAGEVVTTVAGGPPGQPFGGSFGVSVSPSGELFINDAKHSGVDVFEPITTPTTEPATAIGAEGVTLEASIFPEGVATSYQFEYGTTTSYDSVAPATPESAGSGSNPVQVALPITGLQPQTVYHYRVVSSGSRGTFVGPDQTFTTLGPVASFASVASASNSATFSGSVDARGIPGATYRFTVTSSTSPYSGSTAETAVPTGSGSVPVSATIAELPASGTYSARLVVTGGGATAFSEAQEFQTTASTPYSVAPAPPISPTPYGCVVPVLNAYAAHPKAGQTVTITGSDLGVGGELTVGSEHPYTSAYTSTSFAVTLPTTASGKVPVTLNCGHVSNTIDLTIAPPPSNTIGISHSVKGSTATLKIKVPGKGTLSASGTDLRSTSSKPSKKSTITLKVKLGAAGTKALAKAKKHTLTLKAKITYTPTGGTAKSTNITLTFKS